MLLDDLLLDDLLLELLLLELLLLDDLLLDDLLLELLLLDDLLLDDLLLDDLPLDDLLYDFASACTTRKARPASSAVPVASVPEGGAGGEKSRHDTANRKAAADAASRFTFGRI
ncbi:hypothetical protein [Desulfofundulus thermosubterraneus]|uniref:Uncharacterized protein n=1 Tax=Desulfofundulus thermosubterraneus DSM 16057 TaxID=1121432 RepID=A0A1M6JA86_9FIRM|nr:hypothetical protein [Desulfofundulus thermosubterraneus]SHJ43560.1 hypothetical protein SAMN02745219_02552 [Desulfofundulus thermosubterraneus DSM 16057]